MKWLYFSYLTHEDTEAQRNYVTYYLQLVDSESRYIQGTDMYSVSANFLTQFTAVGRENCLYHHAHYRCKHMCFWLWSPWAYINYPAPKQVINRAKLCKYIPWAGRLQNFLFSFENITVEISKWMNPYFQWTHSSPALAFFGQASCGPRFPDIPVIRVHVWKWTVGCRKAGR